MATWKIYTVETEKHRASELALRLRQQRGYQVKVIRRWVRALKDAMQVFVVMVNKSREER